MTDRYPPFRLDMGATEAGALAVGRELPTTPPTAAAPRAAGWSAWRVLLVVFGSLATLVAVALAGGGTVVVLDQAQRDDNGFVMSPSEGFSTPTYALVSERVEAAVERPDWAAGRVPRRHPDQERERQADFRRHRRGERRRSLPRQRRVRGSARPSRRSGRVRTPRGYSHSCGPRGRDLLVRREPRRRRTDASLGAHRRNLACRRHERRRLPRRRGRDLRIGAELPHLVWIGIGLLTGGATLVVIGVVLIYLGVRRREEPVASS